MNDREGLNPPPQAALVLAEAEAIGFTLSCDNQTGSLLRTLAASKPGGQFLEIGTGVGYSTSWLLAGMDADSRLVTVEKDASHNRIAIKHLGDDPRVSFVTGDAAKFIGELISPEEPLAGNIDFIFADTVTGKLTLLDEVLSLVKPGGIFLVDDMLPKAEFNFVPDPRYIELTDRLENHPDFFITKLDWASGLIIATRKV
jgi:predicted O-methyltransferase YrrM